MAKQVNLIRTLDPDIECPIDNATPTFRWRRNWRLKMKEKIAWYGLKVVQLKKEQDAQIALQSNNLVFEVKGIKKSSLDYPQKKNELVRDRAYAFQVTAYTTKGKTIGVSDVGMFYVESGELPFRLSDLICCKNNVLKESVKAWKKAYGNPRFISRKSCMEKTGIIRLSGNRDKGDAVIQTVKSPLSAGKRLTIRFCARHLLKDVDYVKFRVLAFNGTLPTDGEHPETSINIQVIGETSRITAGDWTHVFLPPWKAPRDFESVAILAVTDDAHIKGNGVGEISGICLIEYTNDDCGLVVDALNSAGNINLPEKLKKYVSPGKKPQTSAVSFGRGRVTDIYGDMFDADGKLAWYRENDPCVSLGGVLPEEAIETARQPVDLGMNFNFNDIDKAMENILDKLGTIGTLEGFKPIPKGKHQRCSPFRPTKDLPFGGRDIIYIHGLQPRHITDQILRSYELEVTGGSIIDDGIEARYPDSDSDNDEDFYSNAAKRYWHNHIIRHLGSEDDPSNRYLIVSYNSNQRAIVNVHAVLKQIRDAMSDGKGVIHNDKDPRRERCFGRKCVIISHSAGALITDVAMALAEQSANVEWIRDFLGDVRYIPRRIETHIALHGAIAGSELASLAVVGANLLAVLAPGVDRAVDVGISDVSMAQLLGPLWLRNGLAGFNRNVNAITGAVDTMTDNLVSYARHAVQAVNSSVLVDLSPLVAKIMWGQWIDATQVPVLTVAGGHPTSTSTITDVSKIPLPGYDDGVVNANSQSGSPSLLHPDTFWYIPPAPRIFDMGIPIERSLFLFADQYKGPARAAYASIPWISPTGMVQPTTSIPMPLPRYENHYTFLQSVSDHNDPVDPPLDPDDGTADTQEGSHSRHVYNPTRSQCNYEETLAITDPYVFESELVSSDIVNMVRECVRGMDLTITFSIPFPRFTVFPPSFTIEIITISITIPIWRRRYHQLKSSSLCEPWWGNPNNQQTIRDFVEESERKVECDYVYEFVLKN